MQRLPVKREDNPCETNTDKYAVNVYLTSKITPKFQVETAETCRLSTDIGKALLVWFIQPLCTYDTKLHKIYSCSYSEKCHKDDF